MTRKAQPEAEKDILKNNSLWVDAILLCKGLQLDLSDEKELKKPGLLKLQKLLFILKDWKRLSEKEDAAINFLKGNLHLKDQGHSVVLQSRNGNNITVNINLMYPITTIQTEIKSIVKVFKKLNGVSKLPKPPDTEDFEIYIMTQCGVTKADIIRKILKKKSNYMGWCKKTY